MKKTQEISSETRNAVEEPGIRKLKIMFCAELALFAVLVIGLVVIHTGIFKKSPDTITDNVTASTEQAQNATEQLAEADTMIVDLAVLLLPGDYVSEDGRKFSFGFDGSTYTGYVDADHTAETGTYIITAGDGAGTCHVTITAGNAAAEYSFAYDDETGDVLLTDDAGETTILTMD